MKRDILVSYFLMSTLFLLSLPAHRDMAIPKVDIQHIDIEKCQGIRIHTHNSRMLVVKVKTNADTSLIDRNKKPFLAMTGHPNEQTIPIPVINQPTKVKLIFHGQIEMWFNVHIIAQGFYPKKVDISCKASAN